MDNTHTKGLQCTGCNKIEDLSPTNYSTCCFEPVKPFYSPGVTGVQLRELIFKSAGGIWKHIPLLPTSDVPDHNSGLYHVGLNALVKVPELAKVLEVDENNFYLLVDEGHLTQTFKDRGAAVVAQSVVEFNRNGHNFKALAGTSTGNLSSAIAAVAQEIGLASIVLVNAEAEQRLIDKTISLGAYVLRVQGNYTTINNIAKRLSGYDQLKGIAWVNLELRPIYGEGSKTIGIEIAKQLGWEAPDNIVHPIAAGLSLSRIYQGLTECEKFGLIDNLRTKMHGAQTERCNTIVETGDPSNPYKIVPVNNPTSIAQTLCVGEPSNGEDVIATLKASNGSIAAVTEENIRAGMKLISDYTSFNTGPVGGTVTAVARSLLHQGKIKPNEVTVLVLTDGYSEKAAYQIRKEHKQRGMLLDVEPSDKVVARTLEQILGGEIQF